jgi:hypothetical protein
MAGFFMRGRMGGMTAIHVQIQPNRSPTMDAPAVVARLSSLDASARVTDGVDNGPYINIDFTPVDAMALWREIRDRLLAEPDLFRAAIVACEGQCGWDDYLLLHHYDRTLILDEM